MAARPDSFDEGHACLHCSNPANPASPAYVEHDHSGPHALFHEPFVHGANPSSRHPRELLRSNRFVGFHTIFDREDENTGLDPYVRSDNVFVGVDRRPAFD